jgi:ABC-type phosphate/phosphonate transport system permease subunit
VEGETHVFIGTKVKITYELSEYNQARYCLLSLLLFNIVLEFLARAIKKRKK